MALAETKHERAVRQIEAARIASGLLDFRCANPECGALIMKYEPPVRFALTKCYRCNLYSELRAP